MATYEVTTEDGKTYEVETEEAPKSEAQKGITAVKEAILEPAHLAVDAIRDPIGTGKKVYERVQNADMTALAKSPLIQAGLPIAGGILAGPAAPYGAMGGAALAQFLNAAVDPGSVENTPTAALGRGADMLGAGVMQDMKMLKAIPGVSKVGEMATELAGKTGRGLAKAAQAFSGGKAQDFLETAKKGFKTYTAPSAEKASQKFGEALSKLPGKDVTPTMVEHIQSAITPESSAGSKFLTEIGKRIDDGELITARDALKAKQSLDDVIDTVPIWQTKRRGKLFDIKKTFDDVLSSQSGELKAASNDYRAAMLKKNMLKYLPVNKHGEYSRLMPALAGLGGTILGSNQSDAKKGAGAGLGYLVATSPLTMGLGAATAGTAAKGLTKLAQNPQARQVLFQLLQKLRQQKEKK